MSDVLAIFDSVKEKWLCHRDTGGNTKAYYWGNLLVENVQYMRLEWITHGGGITLKYLVFKHKLEFNSKMFLVPIVSIGKKNTDIKVDFTRSFPITEDML